MKKLLNLMVTASFLGSMLTFTGCSEAPKPEPTPAAPATVATSAGAPKAAGDLGVAKLSLEKAVAELKNQNYAGAAIAVDTASKEVAAVAAKANLPVPIKETIAKVGVNLEPLKALIEKKDTSAEKGLLASIATLGKLDQMTKLMSGTGNAMTGAAGGAASALSGMRKSATEKAGAAADAAMKEAGSMTPKKQ